MVLLLVLPSSSAIHIWRVRLCVVIPVHSDGVSQVLDESFVSETRSSFILSFCFRYFDKVIVMLDSDEGETFICDW